jgi:hypothetical protein
VADKRTIVITAKVSRKSYFLFRDLCRAHGVPYQTGINGALQMALVTLGIPVDQLENESGSIDNEKSGSQRNRPLLPIQRT